MTPSLKRDTWQQHIQAWQQSQLSKKAYCREHNLNSACFYKWYSKLALRGNYHIGVVSPKPRNL
jgi:hypothetical protein